MSITAGIDWDSSDSNSEGNMCRLCMKKNHNFYSIFSSNIAYKITVKDALHDLVGLQVSVGDGLPAIVCPLCVKKLTELSDFKKICFESDAELREISSRITPRPSFAEDGELIESCTMTHKSKMDSGGLPAPDRVPMQTTSTSYPLAERHPRVDPSDNCVASSALVTVIESKTEGSHTGSEGNVMDKDLEKFDALHPDKMTSCSFPIHGQFCSESKISRDGAEVTVVGNRSGCDTPKIPHSLRFVRISENRRIGTEAVKEDKEEIICSLMESPGSSYRPNDNYYHCFNCIDAFDTKIELIKHLDIHFGADNGDVSAESSMGYNESHKTLVSIRESSSTCDTISSMTSNGVKKSFIRKSHLLTHIQSHA
ncbi:uncharacterized protein LOC124172444 isoform X2 [Ischnura elegans]|uniref:uncharacterized protein LOC124172444 isoform X2 n=1 Tax=Ischnura elegans TaxID=197161 RepID=UPI001ED86808|nr:uncharacterized protein LOC124172444 isoform X2 [Ischnura elegans]